MCDRSSTSAGLFTFNLFTMLPYFLWTLCLHSFEVKWSFQMYRMQIWSPRCIRWSWNLFCRINSRWHPHRIWDEPYLGSFSTLQYLFQFDLWNQPPMPSCSPVMRNDPTSGHIFDETETWTRSQLIQYCSDLSSGQIPRFIPGTVEQQRAFASTLPGAAENLIWVQPRLIPTGSVPFTDDFFLGLTYDDFLAIFQVFFEVVKPKEETQLTSTPASSSLANLKNLIGTRFSLLVERMRPQGGTERLIRMAIRRFVDHSTPSIRSSLVHFDRSSNTLFLQSIVPASMKKPKHTVSLFLSANDQLVQFAQCSCEAGLGGCFHVLVPLLQLK